MIFFKVIDNQVKGDLLFEKGTKEDLIDWATDTMQHRAEAEPDELADEFNRVLSSGVSFEYALHILELWDYTVQIHTDLTLLD